MIKLHHLFHLCDRRIKMSPHIIKKIKNYFCNLPVHAISFQIKKFGHLSPKYVQKKPHDLPVALNFTKNLYVQNERFLWNISY